MTVRNRNSAPKYREVSGFKTRAEDNFKDVHDALRDFLLRKDTKFKAASEHAYRRAAAVRARRES